MLNQNTLLVNDINVVLNKLNDHNNITVNTFANMKKQVHF